MTTITRTKGDTYPVSIVVRDKGTRQPIDITGSTFTLSVSDEREPTTATYVFQVTGTITDAVNGKVDFPITSVEANNLGTYFYDIQMVTSTSEIRTIDYGTFVFKQSITK